MLDNAMWLACTAVLAILLLQFNYALDEAAVQVIFYICYGLIIIYIVQTIDFVRRFGWRFLESYELIVKLVIMGAVIIAYRHPQMGAGLIIIEEAVRGLGYILQNASARGLLDRLRTQPALFIASTFLFTIGVGAILLSLPISTTGESISFIDALFTATSATCVTGLVVQDTGTFFTGFGQGVILGLIQVGGLGIMALSTSLALLMGKKLSVRDRVLMQDVIAESNYEEFSGILRNIVRMALYCELIGAVILTARWYLDFQDLAQAAYYGIFHSVSAFCNAGFSLFANSLVYYQSDLVVNLVITFLILFGGFGFTVVYGVLSGRKPTLHIKMTLVVSAIMLGGGMLFILLTEYSNSLLHLPFIDKVLVSWFQSVTLRTAGFNTIDLSLFANSTIFMCCIWMFIGASPGSTGGGIKTTTVGVLFFSVRSMMAGTDNVEAFGRVIPWPTVRKAISITFIAGAILTGGTFMLLSAEDLTIRQALFETVSAMGTVGLSLGVTSSLGVFGKLIITILMFVGRIGPLTIAYLMITQESVQRYTLPEENVIVG